MRVLVTGVAGNLGGRLARALAGRGVPLAAMPEVDEVLGLDVRRPPEASPKLRFVNHDVALPFPAALAQAPIDAAIHLAFILGPARDELRARRINLGGTESFLAFCEAAGVGHLLYLSSTTVYGARPDNPPLCTEATAPRPHDDYLYSRHKGATEAMFAAYALRHPEAAVTVLRACPILGPGLGNAIAPLARQPLLPRVVGHDPPMQFLHVEDLVAAVLLCLRRRPRGVYNLAGAEPVPYSRVARLLGRRTVPLPSWLLYPLVGLLWRLRLVEGPPAGLAFIRYPWVAATEKLARDVGFTPRYSSREALLAFVEGAG